MKVIVCVKQVPDTSGKVAVKPDGTLDRASMLTIINPDDLNAVEAALKLKDETGCEVVVVTMGPPPAEKMLREIIAMGADRGVLISGREFGGSDTFATSQIIAAGIHHMGLNDDDIVMCGRQAIATLCCSPPDSWLGMFLYFAERPVSLSISGTFSLILPGDAPITRWAKAIFS